MKIVHNVFRIKDNDPRLISDIFNVARISKADVTFLANCCTYVSGVPGECAELGVYLAGSTKLIAKMLPRKRIFGFDSFEGFTETLLKNTIGTERKWAGKLNPKLESFDKFYEEIKRQYSNILLFKGLFSETQINAKDHKFSLVHFDGDISESAIQFLDFFYNKINNGGVLIFHDYNMQINTFDDLRKTIDKFFINRIEKVIPVNGTSYGVAIKGCAVDQGNIFKPQFKEAQAWTPLNQIFFPL